LNPFFWTGPSTYTILVLLWIASFFLLCATLFFRLPDRYLLLPAVLHPFLSNFLDDHPESGFPPHPFVCTVYFGPAPGKTLTDRSVQPFDFCFCCDEPLLGQPMNSSQIIFQISSFPLPRLGRGQRFVFLRFPPDFKPLFPSSHRSTPPSRLMVQHFVSPVGSFLNPTFLLQACRPGLSLPSPIVPVGLSLYWPTPLVFPLRCVPPEFLPRFFARNATHLPPPDLSATPRT